MSRAVIHFSGRGEAGGLGTCDSIAHLSVFLTTWAEKAGGYRLAVGGFLVAVPASDQYGSSVSIKVPARGKNQAAGRSGPLGSLLSARAPSGQGTECQGSWTVGRVQPRRGHRPGLLSAQQCRVSFLAAAGQAWVLPSERLEGSGQLPGPRPLPCPLNYGEPQPLRPEESRPGRPPPRLKSADVGQGPRVRLGGSWRKSRERTRFCRFCWPEATANPPQNGVRKTKARMRSSAPGLCQFLSSASIHAGPTLRQDRGPGSRRWEKSELVFLSQ